MKINYDQPIPDYGDLFTVEDFVKCCKSGLFADYDGFGNPCKNGSMSYDLSVYPSQLERIPEDATHVVWFNK